MSSKKAPNPIDVHVGSRVRLRRMMLGMSQEKLGESLGITFQQIQKYEKGTNRIGASRLQHIATILKVPVAFFFEDGSISALRHASALSLCEAMLAQLNPTCGVQLTLDLSRHSGGG